MHACNKTRCVRRCLRPHDLIVAGALTTITAVLPPTPHMKPCLRELHPWTLPSPLHFLSFPVPLRPSPPSGIHPTSPLFWFSCVLSSSLSSVCVCVCVCSHSTHRHHRLSPFRFLSSLLHSPPFYFCTTSFLHAFFAPELTRAALTWATLLVAQAFRRQLA